VSNKNRRAGDLGSQAIVSQFDFRLAGKIGVDRASQMGTIRAGQIVAHMRAKTE
jgi:hypothetical protein